MQVKCYLCWVLVRRKVRRQACVRTTGRDETNGCRPGHPQRKPVIAGPRPVLPVKVKGKPEVVRA